MEHTTAILFDEISKRYRCAEELRECRVGFDGFINNDLTSGKDPIADIERLNSYFLNVLKVAVPKRDTGRELSTLSGSLAFGDICLLGIVL